MAAEGMRVDADDMIVTTGGQQVIDLVTKTLIDPGDVVVAEAPTYPGAVPVFSTYEADVVQIEMDSDGMRIDLLEETLDRLEREGRRPKFIYTVPTFQNPAGVTLSLARRRRLVEIAHERELLVLEDNPYGLLRYEGDAAADAARARRRRVRDLPRHVLEDPLAGHPARLGAWRRRRCWRRSTSASRPPTSAPRRSRSAGRGVLRARADGATTSDSLSELYREPPRRDARRAGGVLPAARPSGRGRAAACSSGPRCPTSSTPRTCWRGRCARTSPSCPARRRTSTGAARNSMRLNFSAVDEDDILEGIRRIGKVIDEQVGLYGTITGSGRAAGRRERDAQPAEERPRHVVHLPRGRAAPARRERLVSRVAVLKGGSSLERQVSLRSGRRVRGRARAARPRGRCRSTSTRTWSSGCARPSARRRVRRAARARRRGRHRPGAARDPRRALHGVRRARPASRSMDKVLTKHLLVEAGMPTPDVLRLQRDRLPGARRRGRPAGDRGAARLPDRREAGRPGLSARDQVRAPAADVPGALVAAFSYDDRGAARAPRQGPRAGGRCSTARRRRGAAGRRGGAAARRTSTTSRPATRSAAPTTSAPPSCPSR